MSDEITRAEMLRLAAAADRFLEDPIFNEAVEAAKQRLMQGWANTSHEQSAEREELYRDVKSLDRVLQSLRIFSDRGKVHQRMVQPTRGGVG